MLGFRRKTKPLVGIDISSTAIKLIELSPLPAETRARFRVEHFAIEPLPPAVMIEKKVADVEQVGKAIAKAVVGCRTRAKRAAVAVAGSAVITKIITLDGSLSDTEMEDQIELDAEQYIPYPLEEVNLDFQVVRPTEGKPGLVDVLLVASRRENVEDRVAALEAAQLTPAVVDVEAYAIENACELILADLPPSVKTVAVVDIGAATTTLHVLSEGRIVYSREQNFGGQQLVDEVRRRYGLARDLAMLKIRESSVGEGYQSDVLEPFKEALTQQIGRALQFFYSGTTFNRVDLILLTGGPAAMSDIDRLVSQRFNIETQVANPFRNMSVSPSVDARELMREAPSMLVALGLALRGFD